ncbi:MAG: ABC transporter ATP-binding protein, partial [Planctomycetes bacterium]|nr:ABC transporter ATP-binding protein [Planctomycetota bacterium]
MPEYEQDLLEDLVKTNVFDPVLIRRMVRYLKPYWHRAALGFGLMLMSTLLTLAPAIIVAAMVDVVFVPAATTTAIPVGDGPAAAVSAKGGLYDFPGMRETIHALVPEGGDLATLLWVFAAVFLLVKVFQFLVDWGNGYLLASVAQSVLFDIRMQVFRHIQTRSIAYFHRHPVGRFVTRVTNDVGSLDEFFSQALVMVLKDIVMLFGVATLLLVFNTELALIVMMTIPPVIVATLVFRRYSRPAFRKFRATVSTLNAQMAESANGIRVIQLFGRAAKNQQRYDGTGREFRQHFLTFRHAHAVFRPVYMSFQAIAL